MIPILILAAGSSSRMGGVDKLAKLAHGQPLLRHVARQATQVGDTFVALHHNADARLALLDGLSVTPLLVPDASEGMSGSLRNAVASLPPCPAFLLVLADMPDITADDMRAVLSCRDANPNAQVWRGATADGKPGHPILFDAALRPRFATLSGDAGGDALVKSLRDATVLHRFSDNRARLDLDTPQDWATWTDQG